MVHSKEILSLFDNTYDYPVINYLNSISVLSFNKITKLVNVNEIYTVNDMNQYDYNPFYQANGWLAGRTS